MDKPTQEFVAERNAMLRGCLAASEDHKALVEPITAAIHPDARLSPADAQRIVTFLHTRGEFGKKSLLLSYVYVIWLAGFIKDTDMLRYQEPSFDEEDYHLLEALVDCLPASGNLLDLLCRLLDSFLEPLESGEQGATDDVTLDLFILFMQRGHAAAKVILSRFRGISSFRRKFIGYQSCTAGATLQQLRTWLSTDEPLGPAEALLGFLLKVFSRKAPTTGKMDVIREELQLLKPPAHPVDLILRVLLKQTTAEDALWILRTMLANGFVPGARDDDDDEETPEPGEGESLSSSVEAPKSEGQRKRKKQSDSEGEDGGGARRASKRFKSQPRAVDKVLRDFILENHNFSRDHNGKHNWKVMNYAVKNTLKMDVDPTDLKTIYFNNRPNRSQ